MRLWPTLHSNDMTTSHLLASKRKSVARQAHGYACPADAHSTIVRRLILDATRGFKVQEVWVTRGLSHKRFEPQEVRGAGAIEVADHRQQAWSAGAIEVVDHRQQVQVQLRSWITGKRFEVQVQLRSWITGNRCRCNWGRGSQERGLRCRCNWGRGSQATGSDAIEVVDHRQQVQMQLRSWITGKRFDVQVQLRSWITGNKFEVQVQLRSWTTGKRKNACKLPC